MLAEIDLLPVFLRELRIVYSRWYIYVVEVRMVLSAVGSFSCFKKAVCQTDDLSC